MVKMVDLKIVYVWPYCTQLLMGYSLEEGYYTCTYGLICINIRVVKWTIETIEDRKPDWKQQGSRPR